MDWRSPSYGMPDWNGKQLAINYLDKAKGPELSILINMGQGATDFTLPPGRTWRRLVDTQAYFDTAQYLNDQKLPLRASANATLSKGAVIPGSSYGVAARSIVILQAD